MAYEETTYEREKSRLDEERGRLIAQQVEHRANEERERRRLESDCEERTKASSSGASESGKPSSLSCSFTESDYRRMQLEDAQSELRKQKQLLCAIKRKKRFRALAIMLLLSYPLYWLATRSWALIVSYHPEVLEGLLLLIG